jgi:membrane protease subunit HflK
MAQPNWGKRNDGPPDLDELWRRFNERLAGMFGGKKSGGGGGDGGEPGGTSGGGLRAPGIGLVAALAVLVWVASGFYIVDAGVRGVVLRFGKYAETTQPGPRWHLPYPFESVTRVNIENVRTIEVGYRTNVKNKVLKEALMLTGDLNIVDIQFAVQYVLKDPENFMFNNRSGDADGHDIVLGAAETAIREVVGRNTMDYAIKEGRTDITIRAQTLMQQILDRYQTGILISKVTMQDAQPPEAVQAAFDDANKAGQDRERLVNEAQAYANDVVPKARGLASRLLQEADGYRQSVIANAEGEAARFRQVLTEYKKAPQVTRQRLYLETVQQVMSSTSKVVVDQKGGGNLIYLPLDKLQHAAAASVPSDSAGSVQLQPTRDLDTLSRSREAFRNREREPRP